MKAERIRTTILKRLISLSSAHYAQLKPKSVEGNLFTYHLKKLVIEGLVNKSKDGVYHLTSSGKLYIDNLSFATFQIRIQPNIVTMLVVQNEKGEYLLLRHSREPYWGMLGFPYGKIHLGEAIAEAAQRELIEKTGEIGKLKHRGDVYILAFKDEAPTGLRPGYLLPSLRKERNPSEAENFLHSSTNLRSRFSAKGDKELVTHVLCHIFSTNVGKVRLSHSSRLSWGKVEDLDNAKYIRGFKDLMLLLNKNSKDRFFTEFTYNL